MVFRSKNAISIDIPKPLMVNPLHIISLLTTSQGAKEPEGQARAHKRWTLEDVNYLL
jgi:hypothetical protein